MADLFANSGDTDQMMHFAASDLGLHCLPITLSGVSTLQWVCNVHTDHLFLIVYLFQPTDYYVTFETFCNNGFGLCVILFVATLIQHTLLQNHHYLVIRQGIRLKAALQVSTIGWLDFQYD